MKDLITTALGGFLLVASMWWVYFDQPVERVLSRARNAFSERDGWVAFTWGYGHYVVFASAAAVGVGLAVAVDQVTGETTLTDLEAALTVTGPVSVYLVAVWLLHRTFKPAGVLRTWACPVTTALLLASSWTDEPVLLSGLVMAALVLAILFVGHLGGAGVERGPDAPRELVRMSADR